MKEYAESNVRSFLKKSVRQFHKFEEYKLIESDYIPEVIEVDEIWINIQGEEVFFGWIAYDPKNKIIIDFILGKRDKETLEKLFKRLSRYRTKIKLCLIDGYKGYEDLIRKYLGRTRNKPLTGVINKSKWSKKMNGFLTYGLFGKSRKNIEDVIKELGIGEKITTALIENLNGQIRDHSFYMKRKTCRLARLLEWIDISLKAIKFFKNVSNGHGTLSFKSSKNWIKWPITPFMEAGILDYVVDIKEFLFTPHT
jgi:IS1 family transposase